MINSYPNVRQIINVSKFQKLQDDISLSTGLALILIDHTGAPLTKHSHCTEFCLKMRSVKEPQNLCEKCDSRGGLEAVRIHNTHIYICHAGIVDMAIPIIVEGLYLGAFMAGQVRLDNPKDLEQLEHIMYDSNSNIDLAYDEKLERMYELLPVMSLEKIKSHAHMLYYFADLCVERSLYKLSASHPDESTVSGQLPAEAFSQKKTNNDIGFLHTTQKKKDSNILLQPSLNYIKNHLDEKITLSKMAALCHISPSYYSKIFSKEGLGSLSNYVNHLKIDMAKELMTNTNMAIGTIANNLGYEDNSYFIKIFKLETGMTPSNFRKSHEHSQ